MTASIHAGYNCSFPSDCVSRRGVPDYQINTFVKHRDHELGPEEFQADPARIARRETLCRRLAAAIKRLALFQRQKVGVFSLNSTSCHAPDQQPGVDLSPPSNASLRGSSP